MNLKRAIGLSLLWLPLIVVAAEPAAEPAAGAAPAQAQPAPAKPAAASQASPTNAKNQQRPAGRAGNDRLDLDTTVVTGNRELPKVLYIVPWKKADLGELPAQPFNTLLDEVLTPVDRDVFRREVTYYGAVNSAATPAAPPASAPSDGTEK